jgi:hypothetical protein
MWTDAPVYFVAVDTINRQRIRRPFQTLNNIAPEWNRCLRDRRPGRIPTVAEIVPLFLQIGRELEFPIASASRHQQPGQEIACLKSTEGGAQSSTESRQLYDELDPEPLLVRFCRREMINDVHASQR